MTRTNMRFFNCGGGGEDAAVITFAITQAAAPFGVVYYPRTKIILRYSHESDIFDLGLCYQVFSILQI
jgi:hypothetical protein